MKIRILILAVLLAVAIAAGDDGKKSTRTKAASSSTPAAPIGPPKTAVEIGPHAYRYVDAQGKVWIYRRTPFGWMKGEEKDDRQSTSKPGALSPDTRAVEDGDNVRFECKTPFGMQRWTRKKSEMTEEEKRVFERGAPPAQSVESAKPASEE
jgi:hypothetical protein